MIYADVLERLLEKGSLCEEEAREVMDACLDGDLAPERLAALLTALQVKVPGADELVGFARSMRAHAARIDVAGPLLDTCGTGGARMKTFNISTTTAFVVAAAGVRVAKHGNRSVTRPSGSADVLERAGARLDLSPQQCARVLDAAGIAFLFAPRFHPAMRHAAPVRRLLGIKTVFNLLGPLSNPAGAQHQVLGVHDARLVPVMAEALARLGCTSGFVVHGEPGCDEATPCGDVLAARVVDGSAAGVQRIDPTDLGIPRREPHELAPVPAEQAPALVQTILAGRGAAAHADAVALNAAFGLCAAGRAADLEEGVAQARRQLASGGGTTTWRAFIEGTTRQEVERSEVSGR